MAAKKSIAPESKPPVSYEAALDELRQLVADLQDGVVNISDLTLKVERADYLLKWCREMLRTTDERLSAITLQ